MELLAPKIPRILTDPNAPESMRSDLRTNILLVDDQLSNLVALEAMLEGLGQNLVRARSGTEALRCLLDEEFAVILMDVQMPIMDGFETAALIREREKTGQTPIIFLTAGEGNDVQMFKGYSLGAVDFLNKPIVPEVLRSKVTVFVDLFQKTAWVERHAELLRANQQREHERALAEERRRWEMDRLREEAQRDKQIAQTLTQRAEELARNISERTRVEQQLRARARQQSIVAGLGHQALAGLDLPTFLNEAAGCAAQTLEVEYARLLECSPEGDSLVHRAEYGWKVGGADEVPLNHDSASLPAYTLRVNEPVIIEDVSQETRFSATSLFRDHGAVSGISVIIRGKDNPIGVLEVFSRRPRRFTVDDVHYLETVANVLAAAIQRKQGERELAAVRDELAEQLADMTSLHELSTRLSNTRDLPLVLAEVLDAVMGLQGTPSGILSLNEPDSNCQRVAASEGLTPEELDQIRPLLASCHQKSSQLSNRSGCTILENLEIDRASANPHPTAHPLDHQAACITPLLTRSGALVGSVLTLFTRSRPPSERQIRLVELYALHAAEYIENARLYREIQESDRHKDEFLAMLGHELRNPLAPMLTALHFMGLPGTDTDEARQAQEIVERQLRHLVRLVDDLLDISRISNGKFHLRKVNVDIADVTSAAIQTARPLIDAKNHRLDVSLPPHPVLIEADQARLLQVIANLLNNAAKYTEPGGHIELSAEQEGEDIVLRVRDNGIGISEELLPHVFDLFTQADRSLDRSQGGLGIGLTLVKRLVGMHEGTVTATSAGPGLGSEFTIRLPVGNPGKLANGPMYPHEPRAADLAGPRRKRVLVVEDNRDGAKILARLLQIWGHCVAVAHDGPAAIELACANQPEVVLLDIGLPGMSGYEVALRLKKQKGLEKMLLVALTGYGQLEDQRRSLAVGFDRHLVKPVDPVALRTLLADEEPLEPPITESLPK